MRKIFANLKSVVALAVVAAMTLSVSCMYDDTALTKRVTKVEKDLAALTEKVNKLDNGAVEDVVDGKVVITGVAKDDAGNVVLTLSNGETVTVLAEAKALQYRVTDGVLEISADGETWVAVKAAADCFIKEVIENQDGTVSLVLANGKVFTSAVAEVIECAATRTGVYVLPETTKAVRFTINDAVVDINVMNQPLGWSATVEEYVAPVLPEEGEDDEFDMGVLAAGGKEYVLNITGPAKDFAQAAKEGVVSVHFNTAAGACKVLKVAVTLAEITLDVDKDGNITLTNSVAYETEFDGEIVTEFANFIIGVVDAKDYAVYGDEVFSATYDDLYEEYSANVNKAYRNGGFQNRVDLIAYVDVVCEKESYSFSVETLSEMFWPKYTFEVGNEYIIFVTLDEKGNQPVLSTAVKATYKPQSLTATYVSSTPDSAIYDFNLAGYSHYLIGWVSVEEINQMLEWGSITSLEDYVVKYSTYGLTSVPGAIVEGPFTGEYSLADLADLSLTGWAPPMDPETEYYFFIYPVNIETENDMYNPVDPANLATFGTFETGGYVAATEPFEHGFTYEYEYDEEYKFLSFKNGAFGENVVAYAYGWYNATAADQAARSEELLAEGLVPTEYGPFEEGTYPSSPVVYLCMIAVNNAYEYVYFEIPIEVPFSYDYDLVFTSCVNVSGNKYEFKNDEYTLTLDLVDALAAGTFVQSDYVDSYWYGNSTTLENAAWSYPAFVYNGTLNVALDGDNLSFELLPEDMWVNNKKSFVKMSFNGTIGAAAAIDLTGYTEAESASVDHNEGFGTVRFNFTHIDAGQLQVYPFFGTESDWHGEVGTSSVEKLQISGLNAESGNVDIYKQADGSYLVMVNATFQSAGNLKFYFYITL